MIFNGQARASANYSNVVPSMNNNFEQIWPSLAPSSLVFLHILGVPLASFEPNFGHLWHLLNCSLGVLWGAKAVLEHLGLP